jgi:glycosyltransferase involved in cell wall biosynthesis
METHLKPILSILIPSTTDRKEMTDKLYHYLQAQVLFSNLDEKVEIIVDMDNKEVSIGAKRQRMIEKAKGKYVVQIDSDDWIPDDYLQVIIPELQKDPDCIGHRIECSGTPGTTESVSSAYEKWCEKQHGFDYIRTPYPKVPIKRDICLAVGYKDQRYGEDHNFAIRLKQSGLIHSEIYIDQVLYFYRYKFAPHAQKYGLNRQTRNR